MSALETLVDSLGDDQPSTDLSRTVEEGSGPETASASSKNKNSVSVRSSKEEPIKVPVSFPEDGPSSSKGSTYKNEADDTLQGKKISSDENDSLEDNIEDPTVLVKCELILDETSKGDSSSGHHDKMDWIDQLRDIEKVEVHDTFDEEYNSYGNTTQKQTLINDIFEGAKSQIQNIEDLRNNDQRRSKYSTMHKNKSILSITPIVSKVTKSSKNYNNISNNSKHSTLPNRFPGELSDRFQNRNIYISNKDIPMTSVELSNSSSLVDVPDDDDNDVSIINDIASELDSSLLLMPEITTSLSSDHIPSSVFTIPQGAKDNALSMAGLSGCHLGPSPSRQSCLCPLCGRHIAQRRSLKQHLMSNFHKLCAADADRTVRQTINVRNR